MEDFGIDASETMPPSQFSSANTATISPICPQQQYPETELLLPALIANQVIINEKVRTEDDLPDCVTINKGKSLQENAPAHPSDLMDHTQGQAVCLYIDLYGFNNKQVHTVFDSGAATSFRLTEFPKTGKFETLEKKKGAANSQKVRRI